MSSRYLRAGLLMAVAGTLAHSGAADKRILRVCADPNNLPFSNKAGQGFENYLAAMIADEMNARLEWVWWPERKSFLRNSLNAGKCDAVMGVPTVLDTVAVSRAYYRSTYVLVTRRDRNLRIRSLFDPELERCRIGIHVAGDDYTPPSQVLARRGLSANIQGFSLFGREGEENPPAKLIDAVRDGAVDVAIIWGPFAGYFARAGANGMKAAIEIEPVSPSSYLGIPFTYDISVAVRKSDAALRDEIDLVLDRRRDEVRALLAGYGVPLVRDGER